MISLKRAQSKNRSDELNDIAKKILNCGTTEYKSFFRLIFFKVVQYTQHKFLLHTLVTTNMRPGRAFAILTLLPRLPENGFPVIEEKEKSLTYSTQIHT
jgi:hypothetical protein